MTNRTTASSSNGLTRRHFLAGTAGASLIALMAAAPASAENVLRWTSQGDALTMDPHSQNEGPTIVMNGQIYESLVTRDAELNLQPELAESWEAGADGWVFNLRKGVKFHDGSDFDAEDPRSGIRRGRCRNRRPKSSDRRRSSPTRSTSATSRRRALCGTS